MNYRLSEIENMYDSFNVTLEVLEKNQLKL